MLLRADNPGPPRIGYVLKRFPRLSETFILNEILELERQGVEVEIFSLLRPPEEPSHDLLGCLHARVTYLPRGKALNFWTVETRRINQANEKTHLSEQLSTEARGLDDLFPGKNSEEICQIHLKATSLAMLASTKGLQHLHAHFMSDPATVAMLASRLTRIPFSFTAHARDIFHTYVDPEIDDSVRCRKIAEAEFVTTVSDYNRRHLIKLAGPVSAEKIHLLYNGIDLERFQPADCPSPQPVFLAVGRLVEKKGFRDLIDACGILARSGRDFRCLIVGEGPDRGELEARLTAAGLKHRVSLLGAMSQVEVINLMGQVLALVLPCVVSKSGDRDGLPTVLLEALAKGLPAISTFVAGIPEIIDNGRSGLLVPSERPEALASAMTRLLSEPELRTRVSRSGRAKAERCFNLSSNVSRLKRLFLRKPGIRSIVHEESIHADCLHHG